MRTFFILLLLGLLAYGGHWYWKKQQGPEPAQVLATDVIGAQTIREVLVATGIVKTQVGAVVKIGVQATGLITRLPYRVGDPVRKGDLIAQIDDRELLAQKGRLAAELNRVEAELEFVRRFVSRQRELLRSRVVDANTVEDAERRLAVTEADIGIRKAEINALDVRLSYTRIFSPIDGVVGNVTAQEGETVVAGLQVANLITVIDTSRLEMWIYMDETDIGRVQPGQPVEFTVDAYPDEVFRTRVVQVYPQPEIRENIVYYQVLCKLSPEQARKLRPEMTTQNKVVVAEAADVLALPNNALKWVDGRNVVFVETGEAAPPPRRSLLALLGLEGAGGKGSVNATAPRRATRQLVENQDFTLGLRGLTHSEIRSGFQAGDVVATQVVLPAASGGGSGSAAAGSGSPGGQGSRRGAR